MSVVIAYPHTSASHVLGSECLSSLYNILFYMPTKTDKEFGEHMVHDLKIMAARSGDSTVEITESSDFSDPEIKAVFFPCLGQ